MNQPLFLQIIERLEGFLGKLPAAIQKPVLHELTPLKELFLQQRAPRLVLTGSHKIPVQEMVATLFSATPSGDLRSVLMEIHRWQPTEVGKDGKVELLDARGADAAAMRKIEEELERQPADIFLHVIDGNSARPVLARDVETLSALASFGRTPETQAKVIGISLVVPRRGSAGQNGHDGRGGTNALDKLRTALAEKPMLRDHLVQVLELHLPAVGAISATPDPAAARLLSLLARELPNQARVEMIRISRDRQAQAEIAQILVKSTSAICTAVGAQPIPLADLPILTTLQLAMVSGIMYISGRERSMRAATEFVGALGVNVGAGMILREGARAMLKFFPGWGNVVCGMVAGAGTYAVGKAATVYFLDGMTLKEARRTYLASRKKQPRAKLLSSVPAPDDN